MNQAAHEIYDGSHHFWYEKDLMKEHEYGKVFNPDKEIAKEIAETVLKDYKEAEESSLMFWYLGKDIENTILMIRVRSKEVMIQINLKDFDFALNLDEVTEWKEYLKSLIDDGILR